MFDAFKPRKKILRCRLAVLTMMFCFGLFDSTFGQTVRTGNRPDQLPIADFCEMLRNPMSFVGKTVVTRTVYSSGFEMGWLEYPKGCDIPDKERFGIRDVFDANFDTYSGASLTKKFLKIVRKREKKNNNLGRVDGLFEIKIREYEKNNPYDTDNRDRFEFVILRVLDADDAKALR